MILGDTCTRGCRFCHVKTGNPHGVVDLSEPQRVAEAVIRSGLRYVVLTSVDRDDLSDGGAEIFAETVEEIKRRDSRVSVEVLTPDFRGKRRDVETVVDAGPDVFDHNIETVRRLTVRVRDPRASYDQSLSVLRMVKEMNPATYTKSSIMLGLGEGEDELFSSLSDLRSVGVDIVTLGQYLQPSLRHIPVTEYVTPEKFERVKVEAEKMGFLYVAAGPLVRSSYRAGENFMEALLRVRGKHKSE
jgi:lipoic acid synthetase